VDRNRLPLAVRLFAASTYDTTQLLPLIDAIPAIIGPLGKPGRPRKRPAKLQEDTACDASPCEAHPPTPERGLRVRPTA